MPKYKRSGMIANSTTNHNTAFHNEITPFTLYLLFSLVYGLFKLVTEENEMSSLDARKIT